MQEVIQAIESISESTQITAENSGTMLEAVNSVNGIIEDVATMSESEKEISDKLEEVVSNFKL